MNRDEFEHEATASDFEVVDVAEAGIDATVPDGPVPLAKPNRSMVRGFLRGERKHGAGFTRPMRKGREGAPE
jgi:hypothetical protein